MKGRRVLVPSDRHPDKGEPDWGWRIEIHAESDLIINMFCINPANGNEEGWVWSSFASTRAAANEAARSH
jgi:hypothetical protein